MPLRIRIKKCPSISAAAIVTAFAVAPMALFDQMFSSAFRFPYRYPHSNAMLRTRLASSIPSELERDLSKKFKESRQGDITKTEAKYPQRLWWEQGLPAMFDFSSTANLLVGSSDARITERMGNPQPIWDFMLSGVNAHHDALHNLQEALRSKLTISSAQDQMPFTERIVKAAYEESFPWLVSLLLSSSASILTNSLAPLEVGASAEFIFLLYCIQKIVLKFNPPTVPQPMLGARDWNRTQNLMWSSYRTVESKREFVMGYFYNAAFEKLRREDALEFLCWVRFGTLYDSLSSQQQLELQDDLRRLEHEVNNGKQLLRRQRFDGDRPLPLIRFNLEHFRFRHKPLPFYGVTHGVQAALSWALLQYYDFSYYPPSKGAKEGLGYWYRPPKLCSSEGKPVSSPSLVFAHGVGGMCFYYGLLQEMAKETDGAIILLDLPFVSLRIADEIPTALHQIQSIEAILDQKLGPGAMACFVGHSFGSTVLSWMVQAKPERVSNCVFIDPVCFHQHLSKSLFNFHLHRVDKAAQHGKPWVNPISIGALMNLAGSEMHTNNAMLRHFWWNTNALWPEDLEDKGIPACVLLSANDDIVPSREVHQLISEFNRERRGLNPSSFEEFLPSETDARKTFVRSYEVSGAQHGELLFNDKQRHKAVRTISSMLRLHKLRSG